MIISHKYKYIFIKPVKVASTSIEISLAKHCGDKDIITPITKYSKVFDEDKYIHPIQNSLKFYNHIQPNEIKKKIEKKIWNNYFKFTVVRNPWDQVVSRFCHKEALRKEPLDKRIRWHKILRNIFNSTAYIFILKKMLIKKSHRTDDSFFKFIRLYNKQLTNTMFYFDKKGNPICDFYMRFENLDNDYKKVCNLIGIPNEKLPKTKNKVRKNKPHYSNYYDENTKEMIFNLFQKEIDFWGYKFEEE